MVRISAQAEHQDRSSDRSARAPASAAGALPLRRVEGRPREHRYHVEIHRHYYSAPSPDPRSHGRPRQRRQRRGSATAASGSPPTCAMTPPAGTPPTPAAPLTAAAGDAGFTRTTSWRWSDAAEHAPGPCVGVQDGKSCSGRPLKRHRPNGPGAWSTGGGPKRGPNRGRIGSGAARRAPSSSGISGHLRPVRDRTGGWRGPRPGSNLPAPHPRPGEPGGLHARPRPRPQEPHPC